MKRRDFLKKLSAPFAALAVLPLVGRGEVADIDEILLDGYARAKMKPQMLTTEEELSAAVLSYEEVEKLKESLPFVITESDNGYKIYEMLDCRPPTRTKHTKPIGGRREQRRFDAKP